MQAFFDFCSRLCKFVPHIHKKILNYVKEGFINDFRRVGYRFPLLC